jgi:hypothetical protein
LNCWTEEYKYRLNDATADGAPVGQPGKNGNQGSSDYGKDGGLCRIIESLTRSDRGLCRKDEGQTREFKVHPGEMEAALDVFKDGLKKMEATDLEANPEATEASMKRQKLRIEGAKMDTVGLLED